jgi:hypothetical protein
VRVIRSSPLTDRSHNSLVWIEEDLFRRDGFGKKRIVISSFLFGAIHMTVGADVVISLCWMPLLGMLVAYLYVRDIYVGVEEFQELRRKQIPVTLQQRTRRAEASVRYVARLHLAYNVALLTVISPMANRVLPTCEQMTRLFS